MTTYQNPGVPRVLTRMVPSRLEMMITVDRERRKRMAYLGSFFQHYSDRVMLFNSLGGAKKGTRFVLDRHKTRAQYCHPEYRRDRYDIRTIKVGGAQYDQVGNVTRMNWDHSMTSTNVFRDPALRRRMSALDKQEAISLMESWGVRYVLLDEVRKPSLVDCKYHKHHIYADKFHWSPFPETNSFVGDADFKWKGDEGIEYANCNAHTSDPRNTFTSLWKEVSSKPKQQQQQQKAPAA